MRVVRGVHARRLACDAVARAGASRHGADGRLMATATFLRASRCWRASRTSCSSRWASGYEARVRAGEWIIREGELADSLYIVRGGKAEVSRGPAADARAGAAPGRCGRGVGAPARVRAPLRSGPAATRTCSSSDAPASRSLIQRRRASPSGSPARWGPSLPLVAPLSGAAPPQTIAVVGLDGQLRSPRSLKIWPRLWRGTVARATARGRPRHDRSGRARRRSRCHAGGDQS